MRVRLALVLGVLGVAAGCGGSGNGYGTGPTGNNNPGSTTTSISVKNNSFDPSATTVAVGSTVTWSWAAGDVAHNVTFDDGPKSADQSSGSYTRTFATAGKYPYHCTIHSGMTGTVTVQ